METIDLGRSALPELARVRPAGHAPWAHVSPVGLTGVAVRATGNNVVIRGPTALGAWNDVVKRHLLEIEPRSAILAGKTITQQDVDPAEWYTVGNLDKSFEGYDRRRAVFEGG